MKEDTNNTAHIAVAHRNFLADAAYFLYEQNDMPGAAKWYGLSLTNVPGQNPAR